MNQRSQGVFKIFSLASKNMNMSWVLPIPSATVDSMKVLKKRFPSNKWMEAIYKVCRVGSRQANMISELVIFKFFQDTDS